MVLVVNNRGPGQNCS